MTDDQRPPESAPSMNELLKAARGITHSEPKPVTNADLNRALRAGFGRDYEPDEAEADAADDTAAGLPTPAPADFGGGMRGTSPVPINPEPADMNSLLRVAARAHRYRFPVEDE